MYATMIDRHGKPRRVAPRETKRLEARGWHEITDLERERITEGYRDLQDSRANLQYSRVLAACADLAHR